MAADGFLVMQQALATSAGRVCRIPHSKLLDFKVCQSVSVSDSPGRPPWRRRRFCPCHVSWLTAWQQRRGWETRPGSPAPTDFSLQGGGGDSQQRKRVRREGKKGSVCVCGGRVGGWCLLEIFQQYIRFLQQH